MAYHLIPNKRVLWKMKLYYGDVIYIYFSRDQTYFTLKATIDKILELSDQLWRNNPPVLAIADHPKYGKLPSPGAWKACIEPLKEV